MCKSVSSTVEFYFPPKAKVLFLLALLLLHGDLLLMVEAIFDVLKLLTFLKYE